MVKHNNNMEATTLAEQEEEITVLRSIYSEDKVKVRLGESGRRLLELSLEVPLEDPVRISDPSSREALVGCLEDVLLEVDLPRDYPEASLPSLEVRCSWMSEATLLEIKNKLDGSEEVGGGVVLFNWAQLAREEASRIVAESEMIVGEEVFDRLVSLSRALEDNRVKECPICLVDFRAGDLETLEGCGHNFCGPCLGSHCEVKIAGDLVPGCPDCGKEIPGEAVARLAGAAALARFDGAMAARSTSCSDWCPRPDCQHPAKVEEDGNLGRCPACGFAFCASCRYADIGFTHPTWNDSQLRIKK